MIIASQGVFAQAPAADLSVTSISVSPTNPTVGTNFTYTVNISNGGPNSATGVVVTDVLPATGVTYVSASAPGGPCTANCGTVTCPVGTLTGSATVTITVTASAVATVRNVAGVAGKEFDSNLGNNSKWIDTTINPVPPPSISSISPAAGPVAGGTSVTIFGSNFVSGATVKFGGTSATGVSVTPPSQINATSPGHVAGTFPVTVTNPDGQTGSYTGFTYQCPTITVSPATLPQATKGISYSQTITASGGATPYTFAVTSGTLPTGLTLSTGGLLSGTPTANGTFNFTVTATDKWNCTASRSYSLTVVLLPPTISSISPTSGSTNGGTPVTINGSNFVAGATVKFGGAPATSTTVLSSSQISATSPGHDPGTFPVTVTNPDGQTASFNSFTYLCPTITVSPTTLPQGVVSNLYSQAITASGGTSPYSFAVTSGALPSGLTLSTGGLLSGTPTAAGTFSFTVTATDAWGCTGSSSYSLVVTLIPPARFYSLTPCRVLDTRNPAGPYGGPALSGGVARTFTIAGVCGVPAGAKAISANLTAVGPTSGGTIIAYPASSPVPLAGMLSYAAGQTIAVQSTIPLDSNGAIGVFPYQAGGTTVNFIVDVSGYFK